MVIIQVAQEKVVEKREKREKREGESEVGCVVLVGLVGLVVLLLVPSTRLWLRRWWQAVVMIGVVTRSVLWARVFRLIAAQRPRA